MLGVGVDNTKIQAIGHLMKSHRINMGLFASKVSIRDLNADKRNYLKLKRIPLEKATELWNAMQSKRWWSEEWDNRKTDKLVLGE